MLPAMSEVFERLRADPITGVYGPPLGPAVSVWQPRQEDGSYPPSLLQWLWMLFHQPMSISVTDRQGQACEALFLPGHFGFFPRFHRETWEREHQRRFRYGPLSDRADVVVVGKHPGALEEDLGYNFVGESGQELFRCAEDAGLTGFLDQAYMTNVCRFKPPGAPQRIPALWLKECAWFLWAELYLIRPRLVVLLGEEAIKHFHGKSATVSRTRGAFLPLTLTNTPEGDVSLMSLCTTHPAAILREESLRDGLSRDLARAAEFCGKRTTSKTRRHYEVLDTLDAVRAFVEARLAAGDVEFAVDCEWSGESVYRGGQLLTVQLSWAPGRAVLIPFRKHRRLPRPAEATVDEKQEDLLTFPLADAPKGRAWARAAGEMVEVLNVLDPVFLCEAEAVTGELHRLLVREEVRIIGHNFRADFPWLRSLGLDLREQYVRGFDTMLAHHLLHETAPQDLMSLALKYTDAPRYDTELNAWANREVGMSDGGFGGVPEAVLYPYALADADVTMDIFRKLQAELRVDREDRRGLEDLLRQELRAGLAIIEIEHCGVRADRGRIRLMAELYENKYRELLQDFREYIGWPEFNARSVQQVRELLFGEEFNGARRRLRPEGALCCELTPVKTTEKPARDWDQVAGWPAASRPSPSTDVESLGILAEQHDAAERMRDLRFLNQICRTYVATPRVDEKSGEVEERCLEACIDPDGRIRTRIFQATETGRWSSRGPNLQNLPKQREASLARLFAEDSQRPAKIRSVFMADDGCVLVENDYVQAELIVLALLSGDRGLLEVLTVSEQVPALIGAVSGKPVFWFTKEVRARVAPGAAVAAGTPLADGAEGPLLAPESGRVQMRPWPRDLHAERAIVGFNLPYRPWRDGPARDYVEATARDRRVAAKSINFGIPYGRSAGAIRRELQQEGVVIRLDECQRMVDGFLREFHGVESFLDRCRRTVRNPGYIVSPFGRYRRFAFKENQADRAAQEREACNFPIQSSVASCLDRAVYNLVHFRELARERGVNLRYRLVLAVHDSVILEAEEDDVPPLLGEAGFVNFCMGRHAAIPRPDPKVCDGLYRGADPDLFPYRLRIEQTVACRWDEPLLTEPKPNEP